MTVFFGCNEYNLPLPRPSPPCACVPCVHAVRFFRFVSGSSFKGTIDDGGGLRLQESSVEENHGLETC